MFDPGSDEQEVEEVNSSTGFAWDLHDGDKEEQSHYFVFISLYCYIISSPGTMDFLFTITFHFPV